MPYAFNPFTNNFDYYESGSTLSATNYNGSDCTGSSPDKNRTLSTSGVTFVYLDGLMLQSTNQYTVSSNTITFLVNVRDSQKIIVVN